MKIKSPKLIFGAIYSIIIFAIFVVVFLIIYDKPHKNDAENKTVSSQNETVSSTVNSNEVTELLVPQLQNRLLLTAIAKLKIVPHPVPLRPIIMFRYRLLLQTPLQYLLKLKN